MKKNIFINLIVFTLAIMPCCKLYSQMNECNDMLTIVREVYDIDVNDKFQETFIKKIHELNEKKANMHLEGEAKIFIPDVPSPLGGSGLFDKSDSELREYSEQVYNIVNHTNHKKIHLCLNPPGAIDAWLKCIEKNNQPLKLYGSKQGSSFVMTLSINQNIAQTKITAVNVLDLTSNQVKPINLDVVNKTIGKLGDKEVSNLSFIINNSEIDKAFYCQILTENYQPIEFMYVPSKPSCGFTFSNFSNYGLVRNGSTINVIIPKNSLPACLKPNQYVTIEGIAALNITDLGVTGDNDVQLVIYSLDKNNEVAEGTSRVASKITLDTWQRISGRFSFRIQGKIDADGNIRLQCTTHIWHELNKNASWGFKTVSYIKIDPQ